MDSIDFVIDSNDRNKLSNGGRLFYYCFGSFLILMGILCYIKAFGNKNGLRILYPVLTISGITWTIKGFIGKQFFIVSKRYFKIQGDKLFIKSPNEKKIVYSADLIENIKLSVSRIDIFIKDYVKSYDLKWITYSEYLELKDKLTLFCNYNKIEIE